MVFPIPMQMHETALKEVLKYEVTTYVYIAFLAIVFITLLINGISDTNGNA